MESQHTAQKHVGGRSINFITIDDKRRGDNKIKIGKTMARIKFGAKKNKIVI